MAVDVGGRGSTIGVRPAKKPISIPKPTVVRKTVPIPRYSAPSKKYSPPSRGVPSRPGVSPPKKPAPTKAPVKPTTKPKKPPERSIPEVPTGIEAYLGTDAEYQQALSGGNRALKDYLSELGRRRGEAGTQFGQTKGSMERDRRRSLDDMREEFASRGLIHSGLFGKEQGDFQEKFSEQVNALEQQQAGLMGDLLSQETNYRRENDLARQQAKQEALLRRAQKYNLKA
jgi:hypothetical protein